MTAETDLGATGIRTSRLGFGCSALVGGRTRRQARYLIEAAFDVGIRHFDVAPLYGSGDAEHVLGDALADRRESVVVVTKVGIEPLAQSGARRLLKPLKPLVRAATRRSPRALAAARSVGGAGSRRGLFEPEHVRASLFRSLKELRSAYVDVLLLHECAADDWSDGPLQEVLRESVEGQLLRAVGTGTATDVTLELLSREPRPAVVQVARGKGGHGSTAAYEATPPDVGMIVHGVFRDAHEQLRLLLAGDAGADWSRRLGLDASANLPLLLLAEALEEYPRSVVLFSSGSAERIRTNAGLLHESPYEKRQLEEFGRLVAEANASAPRGSASD